MENIVLKAEHITKYFHDPAQAKVLDDICIDVKAGEFISVIGKSGCGKSTLLYILSTLDTDYAGRLSIAGEVMRNKNDLDLARVRNERIGFVFQFHYLLNEFSVLQNVMLPALKLSIHSPKKVEEIAFEKLRILGMDKHSHKKPYQLSGGEKQRVAIARALINDPLIIMADEPTGNLDKRNGEMVFDIFKQLSQQYHQSLLIVTHDTGLANHTGRIIEMEDGKIISK